MTLILFTAYPITPTHEIILAQQLMKTLIVQHFCSWIKWRVAEQLDRRTRLVSEANQRVQARDHKPYSPRSLSNLSGTDLNEAPRVFLFFQAKKNGTRRFRFRHSFN